MKKAFKISLLLLVLCSVSAVVYYYFNPKKALNIIVPKIDQVENINIKFVGDTAFIDMDLKLQNKSFFKLHIDSMIYVVSFDSVTILAKAQYMGIELAHAQIDTTQLPLALPYKRLMKKIKSLQGQDSVDIQLNLRIVYATIFGRTAIPYTKKIRIGVPHPPKIEVEKMELVKRDGKTLFMLAHIKVLNFSKMALNISDIKYHIIVKDLLKAEGSQKKEIQIKPLSNISLELPIKVELKSIFKTLRLIVTNKDKVKYHLTLTALIQNDNVGDKKTPLEVEKEGIMELKK